MVNGESETASNGNLGPLSMNLFLNWVVKVWEIIPESVSSMFDNSLATAQFNGVQDSESSTNFLDKLLSLVTKLPEVS